MSESPIEVQDLDKLIEALEQALVNKDWEQLTTLNGQVRSTIEPVMAQLETGKLDAETVRERLATLQTFCDAASAGALEARKEAEEALKGVNRNRSAASAYKNVSTNRPK
ncbi:SOS cell division inhibitor [Marinobacter sp.]|uniref:SOS cell division inhibitor n=1 Tax=Marinobacter sp. TaxID=50741 RepID=UPI0034A2FE25